MLQSCIQPCVEFSPSSQPLNDPISPSHLISIPPTVGAKYVSGLFLNFIFTRSQLQSTSPHIECNEGGSIRKEHNEESPMNPISFLNWMEMMDQQCRFQLDLEQDRLVVICTVKNRSPNCRKRTVQYLIKKLVSDLIAWTTLHQENKKGF